MRTGHLYVLYDFFFFNDTATPEIYTLSLHAALPICGQVHVDEGRLRTAPAGRGRSAVQGQAGRSGRPAPLRLPARRADRKSTRLNSSHANISYAVFCLKKKNTWRNQSYWPLTTVRSC